MRRIYILFLLMFVATSLRAQVNVIFVPEVYGRNLNGLFNCTIVNSGQRLFATLTITVTERTAGTICVARTPEFEIPAGSGNLPMAATRGASISFGNSRAAGATSQTRSFPGGDYDYCYELTFRNSDKPAAEQCFSYTLAPFTDLNLIEPYDKEKICNKRPVLTWQPLIPTVPGSAYQLVLSEIKQGQNATEALNYNLPIINQRNIQSPVLPYPPIAKELETGKKYAWQVTAYKDQTILMRSEVWEFTLDCRDSVKKNVDNGYRNIEDLVRGNFYSADGELRFALTNAYNENDLKYKISGITSPNRVVKGLPKIKILKGENKVNIDLSGISAMRDGEYYILTVWLPDGSSKDLRFIYHEAK